VWPRRLAVQYGRTHFRLQRSYSSGDRRRRSAALRGSTNLKAETEYPLAAADEMYDLQLRAFLYFRGGPIALLDDLAIQLYGYTVGRNSQRVQQV